jgi:hypothetical protein
VKEELLECYVTLKHTLYNFILQHGQERLPPFLLVPLRLQRQFHLALYCSFDMVFLWVLDRLQERLQSSVLRPWLKERHAPGLCALSAGGPWGCGDSERLRRQVPHT